MTAPALDFERMRLALAGARLSKVIGRVLGMKGLVIRCSIPDAFVGEVCVIHAKYGSVSVSAEVVGFEFGDVLLMPLGEVRSIGIGCAVTRTEDYLKAPVGPSVLGRVLNGIGEPIDGRPLEPEGYRPIFADAPHPIHRRRIRDQFPVGIKAIDAMLALGEGQRVGIFAAAGGGKSTLMGMISRNTTADVRVIVLVGERGREVLEFQEDNLKGDLSGAVLIVATAEQPSVVRLKAAYIGTTIAEHFRDQGKKVVLMVDSVTRFARALREIGLARGEPPARYGFPPSVFAELPKLFERCGNSAGTGSITGLYTVLVEGDNLDEPVSDESKSLLDGHIILSAKVKYRPAIQIVGSESRVKGSLDIEKEVQIAAEKVNTFLKQYSADEQALDFGFFSDDKAVIKMRKDEKRLVDEFMAQDKDRNVPLDQTKRELVALSKQLTQ